MKNDDPLLQPFRHLWWVNERPTIKPIPYAQMRKILLALRNSMPFERNPERWYTYDDVLKAIDTLHSDRAVDEFPGPRVGVLLAKAAQRRGWDVSKKKGHRVPHSYASDTGVVCVRCGQEHPREDFAVPDDGIIRVGEFTLKPNGRAKLTKLKRTCAGCRLSEAARKRRAGRAQIEYRILADHERSADKGTSYRLYDLIVQRSKRATANYLLVARREKREPAREFYAFKARCLRIAEQRLQDIVDSGEGLWVRPAVSMSWTDLLPEDVRQDLMRRYEDLNQCQWHGRRPVLDDPLPKRAKRKSSYE